MELLLATGNKHKREEFTAILPDIAIATPGERGLPFECEETGESFIANALIKAETLYQIARRPVLADDSGLCVDALEGAPGIYSARYGETAGRTLSAEQKYRLLLRNLEGSADRGAAFVCALVLYLDPQRIFIFQENCPGLIAAEPSGSGGFGYDPVFYLPRFGKTMAELTEAEKNEISHRGRAGAALRRFLENQGELLGMV